ncbi:hypothetical protein HK096_008566, partial [Nowakowskiella sp. JEL0078]
MWTEERTHATANTQSAATTASTASTRATSSMRTATSAAKDAHKTLNPLYMSVCSSGGSSLIVCPADATVGWLLNAAASHLPVDQPLVSARTKDGCSASNDDLIANFGSDNAHLLLLTAQESENIPESLMSFFAKKPSKMEALSSRTKRPHTNTRSVLASPNSAASLQQPASLNDAENSDNTNLASAEPYSINVSTNNIAVDSSSPSSKISESTPELIIVTPAVSESKSSHPTPTIHSPLFSGNAPPPPPLPPGFSVGPLPPPLPPSFLAGPPPPPLPPGFSAGPPPVAVTPLGAQGTGAAGGG